MISQCLELYSGPTNLTFFGSGFPAAAMLKVWIQSLGLLIQMLHEVMAYQNRVPYSRQSPTVVYLCHLGWCHVPFHKTR